MIDVMTLSSVLTKQQQIQLVQISKDRAQVLLTQFRNYNEHNEGQARLIAAITQLQLVEAELMGDLGFDKAADKLRNGNQIG